MRAYRIFLAIWFAALCGAKGVDGTIPNLSYSPAELFQQISPQLGNRSMNQPSVFNGYLILAGNAVHEVWDIANPYAPVHKATMASSFSSGEAESHQVTYARMPDGTTYLATISGRGVDIWNVTVTTNPVRTAEIQLPNIDYGDVAGAVWGLCWQGKYLYVGATVYGLYILDVSNPAQPQLVKTFSRTSLGGVSAGPLFALGNLLVVVTPKETAGIATVDIRNPTDPQLLDTAGLGGARSYIGCFYGGNAYLTTPLRIFDVTTDPQNIQLLASVPVPQTEYMSFAEHHMFLGGVHLSDTQGAYKYSITNLTNPAYIGRFIGGGTLRDSEFNCPVGNLVVVADDQLENNQYVGGLLAVHDLNPDTNPPVVMKVYPANGAAQQPIATKIAVSMSEWPELATVNASNFIVRPVGGAALSGVWSCNYTVLNFAPDEPLIAETAYEIILADGGITDLVGNPLATEFRSAFYTAGSFTNPPGTIELPPLLPTELGSGTSFAVVQPVTEASYQWEFGDGHVATGPSVAHSYAAPGRYIVTLHATFSPGNVITTNFIHIVHPPLTASAPTRSSTIVQAMTDRTLWVANPDTDTVTAVDTIALVKRGEYPVGDQPETLAEAPDGTIWVVNHKAANLSILAANGDWMETVSLPRGSQPYGIAFAPNGGSAFISLQALGQVVKIDAGTRTIVATLTLPPDSTGIRPQIRGVAVNADSSKLFVTRFISPDEGGQVYEIDPVAMALMRTIALAPDPGPDTSTSARGIPNYLSGLTISPGGDRIWIPSKKDNIQRGPTRDGNVLTHDATVRAITSVLDPVTGMELLAERVDYDDHDRAHAVAFSALGDLAFVSMPGNNHVQVVSTYSGQEIALLPTELAPTGVWFDVATQRVYALNFLSRSLSVFDVADLANGAGNVAPLVVPPISLVTTETLAAPVLAGKQLFYDATSQQLNQESYMSCASCHLDGSQDGRVWDFTGSGEGLRNTIDLRGRGGMAQGRLHWSANFDEVQDFEKQIRDFGAGTGLMDDTNYNIGNRAHPLGLAKQGLSADLDALAAYVASLNEVPASPFRNPDGSLTLDAVAGRQLFNQLNCYACHGGEHFTDSPDGGFHDVGTIQASSGQRLGNELTGIDTPTLRGIWATPPYLHDGSAPTLWNVLTGTPPASVHNVAAELSASERDQLVAYLVQIDDLEPAASPAALVGLPTYADYVAFYSIAPQFAGPLQSADADAMPNLQEYALGGSDPVDAESCWPLRLTLPGSATGAPPEFLFSFLRKSDGYWLNGAYHAGDLAYAPAASADLAQWTLPIVEWVNPGNLPVPPAQYEWVTFKVMLPSDDSSHGFARVKVGLR